VSRSERVCKTLPMWMLRMILASGRRGWWAAAWLEIWHREIASVVEAESSDSGPWPVVMPVGRN
jgi:hypothetical protein